jgi:hypothetical protein
MPAITSSDTISSEMRSLVGFRLTDYLNLFTPKLWYICFKPMYFAAFVGISSRVTNPDMFVGLLDPDPLVTGTDPDPSIIKQK